MPDTQIFAQMEDVSQHLWQVYERDGSDAAAGIMAKLEMADLAKALDYREPEQRPQLFSLLDSEIAAEVLEELEPEIRDQLLTHMNDERLLSILRAAKSDDAVYFLDHLDNERANTLLARLSGEHREHLTQQLQAPEDSAGRIMSRDVVAIAEDTTVSQIHEQLRRQEKRLEGYVYVIDNDKRLQGRVALRDLVASGLHVTAGSIMKDQQCSVGMSDDRETVATLMQTYHLRAVPVIDEQEQLLGEITWDDAVDVLEAEAEEDMLAIAGTAEDLDDNDSPWGRAKQRLPFLLITTAGGFITAFIIDEFSEQTLSTHPALMGFLPLVPALGGNIGIQSATVTVRSIATGELTPERLVGRVIREICTGSMLAIILAAVCGIGALCMMFLQDGDMTLALIIAVSLLLAVLIAATFGVFIPLGCNKLKIDPAIAAGPFITMLNDITGVAIYLIAATMLLKIFLP